RRRGVGPCPVLTGTLRRHRETADAVAVAAGWSGPMHRDAGWDEFNHEQVLARQPPETGGTDGAGGQSRAEFQRWFEAATRRWSEGRFDDEYDEGFAAFSQRVDGALRRAVDRLAAGGTAVVVTSGGPVAWVAASLLDGGRDGWARLHPVVVNASVTKVVVGGRGTTLVSFNDHGHLETDGVRGLVTYR
ncbi:MAG: histidine phosphatase family protein, partial [Nocardioidaceae bacterium]